MKVIINILFYFAEEFMPICGSKLFQLTRNFHVNVLVSHYDAWYTLQWPSFSTT